MSENSSNSQKFYQKKSFIISATAILIFGISFLAGYEYRAYVFRQSIADVFSGIGNSTQSQAKSEAKPKTQVKFGQNVQIKDFSISLAKVETKKEVKGEYTQLQTAKNEWLVITLSGENQSKKADGFYLGNIKLVSNGAEYKKANVGSSLEQLDKNEVPNGFERCLECSNNPNEKAQSRIYFDVKSDLSKDKLIIDDFAFDLK